MPKTLKIEPHGEEVPLFAGNSSAKRAACLAFFKDPILRYAA
jgi:hypothetical protein